MKNLSLPELSLVVLMGPSGAGKTTFARRHFRAMEVLSSDVCRGLVSDDENSQAATADAFDVLHFIADKRLAAGRLTVVDATNVQPDDRKPFVELARRHHCLPVAIVFDLPERVCRERNLARTDRDLGPHVVRRQLQQLHRSLRNLQREGFRHVFVLKSADEVEHTFIERQPLWNNHRFDHGPFDIIGDVHGCHDELTALLAELGYLREGEGPYRHPEGRKMVFLGDLVDRGPAIPAVLELAMTMVAAGTALCVPGNHEIKLLKKLRGKDVKVGHGLAETLAQLADEPPEFHDRVARFIDGLVSHYVLDDGKLVVAHAGLKEKLQGRGSGVVRAFALYGETTGETDDYGLPVRYDWASEYRGKAKVVYGHTPVPEPEWLNGTICVDTGCVFGGRLTALRYPECELRSVPAARVYCEPARPLTATAVSAQAPISAQQAHDDLLSMDDVLGKRIVETRLHRAITLRPEHSAAALEAMSRFAADPRWLIYLPPTMSPSDTSLRDGVLEHPAEALAYFRERQVGRAVCEEKHMGSRAVLVVCRDEGVARRRFGVQTGEAGACYTRTGRRFFSDAALEVALLDRVRAAANEAALWDELATDWLCLDAELLPWSVKAQALLRSQYAAVGAAAVTSLTDAVEAIDRATAGGVETGTLLPALRERTDLAVRFREAYRRYCWPVETVDDLRIAPFHLLASEGAVHADKDHLWHLSMLTRLTALGGVMLPTRYQLVDLADETSHEAAIAWWEALTANGGEGMVVKPLDFFVHGPQGLIQPAVKCRGREYLRIIYGPEYTLPAHLARLRSRGLGAKRSLALREFALGIEALERFVRREPLRRVHECIFGVLALESEPVDPRL